MLIKGTALVWYDDQEYELAEGGVVFLPRGTPHGYRITSKRADLLMINTPGGIEGMFRATGRDKSAPPLPEGETFQPSPEQDGRISRQVRQHHRRPSPLTALHLVSSRGLAAPGATWPPGGRFATGATASPAPLAISSDRRGPSSYHFLLDKWYQSGRKNG